MELWQEATNPDIFWLLRFEVAWNLVWLESIKGLKVPCFKVVCMGGMAILLIVWYLVWLEVADMVGKLLCYV
jgi:hypothetical protein